MNRGVLVQARNLVVRLVLVGLCAGLSWLATPGLGGQVYLAGVALTPVFLLMQHGDARRAFGWTLLGAMTHYATGKWQTFEHAVAVNPGLVLPDAVLLLLFFASLALPYAVFAVLWLKLRSSEDDWLSPWRVGFVLALLIMLSPKLFPYTPVVLISSSPALIQLADVGGEALLLGLLLTVNAGVAHFILHARRGGTAACIAALAMVLPLVAALSYGLWSQRSLAHEAGQSFRVLGMQSQWPSRSGDQVLLRDARQGPARSAVELTRQGLARNPQCQAVVWPETPRAVGATDRSCERAGELATELQRPVLANCHVKHAGQRIFPARLYNESGLVAEHRKSRLIPAYEKAFAGHAVDHLSAGDGPSVFKIMDLPVLSPSICFEVHFAADLRQATIEGAELFLHMANFSLFRSPLISHWDLAMVRLRAVENRRSIVRSVNAGLAGAILPNGRWLSTLSNGDYGAQCHEVPLNQRLSVYTRYGHAVFYLLLGFIVLAGFAGKARIRGRVAVNTASETSDRP
ncbi:MAG: nitrilase-related carbon-nitrogen hydrolase [Oceanococcus sp.]